MDFRITYECSETQPGTHPDADSDTLRHLATSANASTTIQGSNGFRLKSTDLQLTGLDDSAPRNERELVVQNNEYLLVSRQPAGQRGTVDQFDFVGQNGPNERAILFRDSFLSNDILDFGFKDGKHSLEEHLKLHPSVTRWSVDPQQDGTVRIARFSPVIPDGSVPDCEWFVDPARGGLITRVINRDNDKTILFDLKVLVEQIKPEIWFPVGYTRTRIDSATNVTVTNAEINVGLKPGDFDWPAFGGTLEGFRGIRERSANEATSFAVENGVPIEKDIRELFEISTN